MPIETHGKSPGEWTDATDIGRVGMLIQGDDIYGVATVTKHIARLYPEMHFIAFNDGPEADAIGQQGARVDRLESGAYFRGFSPKRGFLPALLQIARARKRWIECARELNTWCEQTGVHLLHGHVFAHYFTLTALRELYPGRYRIVWHIHNNLNVTRHFGIPARFNWRQVRRGADCLLCVSRAVAAGWAPSGVPVEVIHNCFPFEQTGGEIGPEAGRPPKDGALRLVLCGRMDWCKGHHVAVEAVSLLRNRNVDITLDVFGGPLEENDYFHDLDNLVRARGLEDVVRFRGFVRDFVERLPSYDVALQCRIDPEPCSMYVLECMGAGVPVVASSNGGTPELLRDWKEGVLYPPGDANALADAIERLVRDSFSRRRIGVAAKARAHREFSEDAFGRKLRSFYQNLLERPPGFHGADRPRKNGFGRRPGKLDRTIYSL